MVLRPRFIELFAWSAAIVTIAVLLAIVLRI
jgi:hypothetical protein